jgi:integrase
LNHAPHIRKLSEADNVRTDFFSEVQLRAVIESLPEDLRDYVRFVATRGIRKGELSALRWDMLQGSTLYVPASICKNRKGRTLPLVGEMLAIVERQEARRRVEVNGVIEMCPYIFHRAGECGPIGEFRKSWKTADDEKSEREKCDVLRDSVPSHTADKSLADSPNES